MLAFGNILFFPSFSGSWRKCIFGKVLHPRGGGNFDPVANWSIPSRVMSISPSAISPSEISMVFFFSLTFYECLWFKRKSRA